MPVEIQERGARAKGIARMLGCAQACMLPSPGGP